MPAKRPSTSSSWITAPSGLWAMSAQPPVAGESPAVSPGGFPLPGGFPPPGAPPPPFEAASGPDDPAVSGLAGPYQVKGPSTLTSLIQYATPAPSQPGVESIQEKVAEVPASAPPAMSLAFSCTRSPPASLR